MTQLIDIARDVVNEHQYTHIDIDTGERVAVNHPNSTILDATTANLLVACFDALEKKERFQQVVKKRGVLALIDLCWKATR